MADAKKSILLCAGGTGGHLFPAQALAQEMVARGWAVYLATDDRAKKYTENFPAIQTHIIKSATFSGLNPLKLICAVWHLASGVLQARKILREIRPDIVVGFGGYPTVPPLWASSSLGITNVLHEQNAVMGRANRLLAKHASAIVMGFDIAQSKPDEKIFTLGNPVRQTVIDACKIPYDLRQPDDAFSLVVFGGSQGAQYFSKVLPDALALLQPEIRNRVQIVQQARPEDEVELRNRLIHMAVENEIAPFFSEMARRIGAAHLVIARAGASSVSELAMIGRPSILVPYPFALDHDQAMNAAELEKSGGCKVISQAVLTSERLAEELTLAINSPKVLEQMAKAAKQAARINASADLANLVIHLADGRSISEFAVKETHS